MAGTGEVSGINGNVSFSNTNTNVNSWTITNSIDIHDKTDFADAGQETSLTGVKRWSATTESRWDGADTAVPGASATLTLTAYTGDTYAGTALLESYSISTSASGEPVTITYNFKGNGALTITL